MAALAVALAPARATLAQAPAPAPPAPRGAVGAVLDSLRRDPNGLSLAPADVRMGTYTVPAGEKVTGSIATWHGDLDVRGIVNGNAVAIGGNVVIHEGAIVHGDALALGGDVRNDGGSVEGEMRTISALTVGPLGATPLRTPAQATRRSVSLAVGWYLVLGVIGLGVVLFARSNLETIAERIREDFSRAFLFGVLGQLAILPAIILSVVALAITIIGVLLIPFAVVALILAAAGALALGFLGMSFVTGEAVLRRGDAGRAPGGVALQLLLVGLSLYFLLWVLGAAFTWAGVVGAVLRLVAAVVTWVAVTVGFGATLASRGGTRPRMGEPAVIATPVEDYQWQTPTPVTGVAAARRPTPPPRAREP
ncbi:MAG TPA: hypothetical protein VF041_20200 [Gemmatimonadaceae bacterium]